MNYSPIHRSARWLASGAISVLVLWACAATPSSSQIEPPPAPAPAEPAPATASAEAPTVSVDHRGPQILQNSCTACHDLGVLTPRPAEFWPEVIGTMQSYGAQLSHNDEAVLLDYLSKTYSTPSN